MKSIVDVSECFSADLIAQGLARLWVVDADGFSLVPNVDVRGARPSCPITLLPAESPVLLGDGFVYEEPQILRWLQAHDHAPCTNKVLQCRSVLRLAPLQAAVEKFLFTNGSGRKSCQAILEDAIGKAQASWSCIDHLNTCIERAETELHGLIEMLASANLCKNHLIVEMASRRERAVVKLQARVRAWRCRRHLVSVLQFSSRIRARQTKASYVIAKQWIMSLRLLNTSRSLAAGCIQDWWRDVLEHKASHRRSRLVLAPPGDSFNPQAESRSHLNNGYAELDAELGMVRRFGVRRDSAAWEDNQRSARTLSNPHVQQLEDLSALSGGVLASRSFDHIHSLQVDSPSGLCSHSAVGDAAAEEDARSNQEWQRRRAPGGTAPGAHGAANHHTPTVSGNRASLNGRIERDLNEQELLLDEEQAMRHAPTMLVNYGGGTDLSPRSYQIFFSDAFAEHDGQGVISA